MADSSIVMRIARTLSGTACAVALLGSLAGCERGEVAADGSPVAGVAVDLRRLTESQYRQVIADVFGADIAIGGRFEPGVREAGLLESGASLVSVTASGFEEYEKMSRAIADQVVDEKHRALLVPCVPERVGGPDDQCARNFLAPVGRLLLRRPLSEHEIATQVAVARSATEKAGDFYKGLSLSLAGMMTAPQFLFRAESTEPDPDHPGLYRLDAYSKASRLSFLLWNAGPDEELLRAAEQGELATEQGLSRQVDQMLASPRLEAGMRAFFSDMLQFDLFDALAKDTTLFAKFNFQVARDAKEQTLRSIVDQLLVRKGDYRDLFTSQETFLTPRLASLYKVAMPNRLGMPEGWERFRFPKEQQQAGILTHASFVALHSHPGRSSPTLRGKALREVLLCQKVPDPPGNVNFNIVQDTANPNYKTVRQRLTAHSTDATCAGCHKIMDPIGLALENFDTTGTFRHDENGAPIDTSGELDGRPFADAAGLGKAVHDSPDAAACLVNRLYSYGVGRHPTPAETFWLGEKMVKAFSGDGYRITDLLRRIATSGAFYRVAAPKGLDAAALN